MEYTKQQAIIILNLLSHDEMRKNNYAHHECFQFGSLMFLGNYRTAVELFAKNNPTGGDFYVWLQDNYKILT